MKRNGERQREKRTGNEGQGFRTRNQDETPDEMSIRENVPGTGEPLKETRAGEPEKERKRETRQERCTGGRETRTEFRTEIRKTRDENEKPEPRTGKTEGEPERGRVDENDNGES